MSEYNWSTFTKRIPIKAEPTEIFRAWTIPGQLEEWFLRKALFQSKDNAERSSGQHIQKNDTYRWYWHGWSDDIVEEGTVLDVRENSMLKFVFGKAGIVQVSIKAEEGETVCELIQSRIPDDEEARINFHIGCGQGWTFYLTNLKSILEGGIDLRNKNQNLQQVINS